MNVRPPRVWLALALLCVTTLIAYAPAFLVPFQFDDWARIANNQALAEGRLWAALTWFGNTRVLPSLTLWVDYQLYGDDPVGYHVVNLVFHIIAACGVFALAVALCTTPRLRGRYSPPAVLTLATVAALLFALHPIETEAVTYIIQRATVMSAACYIWAAATYVRARVRPAEAGGGVRRFAVPLLLGVAAVLSKENAVSLPLALLLIEWVCFQRPSWRYLTAGGAALLLLAVAVVAVKALLWNPQRPDGLPPFAFWQRMYLTLISYGTGGPMTTTPPATVYALTQATVLPRYLALIVLPWGQNVDPTVVLQPRLAPAVLTGVALIVALLGAGAALARRAPLATIGVWWFFVALSVESSLLPLADAMAERRLYLAMPGVALAFGALFVVLQRRWPRAVMAAGAVAVAALTTLTAARNEVWQSQRSLWRDAADKSPDKARPWANLASAHLIDGRLDAAVDAYCKAFALAPDDEVIQDGLLEALTDLGRVHLEPQPVPGHEGAVMFELPDFSEYCPPVDGGKEKGATGFPVAPSSRSKIGV